MNYKNLKFKIKKGKDKNVRLIAQLVFANSKRKLGADEKWKWISVTKSIRYPGQRGK